MMDFITNAELASNVKPHAAKDSTPTSNSNSAKSTPSKSSKKVFSSWFKTTKTVNNNCNESVTTTNTATFDLINDTAINCERSKSPDSLLREFPGVQTLRNLWNKRISADEQSCSEGVKLNKSISCLHKVSDADKDLSTKVELLAARRIANAKRALSLHDCSDLTPFAQDANSLIDTLHRRKDNFYKYKTAEQAAQHLARETRTRTNVHFPAVQSSAKGERIQWLKRQPTEEAIVSNCNENMAKNKDNNHSSTSATLSVLPTNIISDNSDITVNKQEHTDMEPSISSDTDTLTAVSQSPERNSRKRTTKRDTAAGSSKRGSADTVVLPAIRATVRRSTSNAARKYSFKTHSRNYFVPRKMISNNNNMTANATSAGSGASNNGNFSMVAKLTQQFNEMIQKDKKLLEEVKRKNGVLMSRGGHVYKVLDAKTVASNSASPSVSRTSSRSKDINTPRISTVQRNIKKFENAVETDKSKLPLKYQQQRKCNDANTIDSSSNGSSPNTNKLSLNLQSNMSVELLLPKVDAKKTHNALATLEVVKEEARTPMETEEKSIATTCNQVESQTAEQLMTQQDSKEDTIVKCANNVNHDTKTTVMEQTTPHADNTDKQENNQNIFRTKTIITTTAVELTQQNNNIMAIEQATPLSAAATEEDCCDAISEEKAKQRKHKYAKLYEKLRFRSPFGGGGGQSKKSTPNTSPEKLTLAVNATNIETEPEPEAKILDALEVIDQKLKGLSNDTENAIILRENDDFEQRVLPNNSFVYQASAKQVKNNQLIVTQAVNVALVNSIEGEQMIMEQKDLQKQLNAQQTQDLENIYEPIQPKTETMPNIVGAQHDADMISAPKPAHYVNELIYQTVDELLVPTTPAPLPPILLRPAPPPPKQLCSTSATPSPPATPVPKTTDVLSDYESIAGSSEAAASTPNSSAPTTPLSDKTKRLLEDGYEICEPQTIDSSTTLTTPAVTPTTPTVNTAVRNTNDKLPELPKPKRRLPKSPMPGKKLPAKPAHMQQHAAKTMQTHAKSNAISSECTITDYYADDENIYDTIKGSHCYESVHNENAKILRNHNKGIDTISLHSNCYESITNYRRIAANGYLISNAAGSNSGSTLTISSDHKTNSLYEMSYVAGLRRRSSSSTINCETEISAIGQTSNSNKNYTASSDNSDEWIDIPSSDAEGDGRDKEPTIKQQFIVVRERFKIHRSPDWSKRVRDKRLQQKKASTHAEEESEHYYESLSLYNKRTAAAKALQQQQQLEQQQQQQQEVQSVQQLPHQPQFKLGAIQRNPLISASTHAIGAFNAHAEEDDYDSFDSYDEIYEASAHMKNVQHDSNEDVCPAKLPEPPQSTNQVYSIVKKFKNFIISKKSPTQKHSGSQPKLYENSTPFAAENLPYENTPFKTKSKISKSARKVSVPTVPAAPLPPIPSMAKAPEQIYENAAFLTELALAQQQAAAKAAKVNANANALTVTTVLPVTPTTPTTPTTPLQNLFNSNANKQLSTSERNLSTNAAVIETPNNALQHKTKAGKSFKSRLRRSLVGAGFDSKELHLARSTFYVQNLPTTQSSSGELDSGFSDKTSSVDALPGQISNFGNLNEPTTTVVSNNAVLRKSKRESKHNNAMRRRTTIGIRPNDPPPPPPEDAVNANEPKMRPHTTAVSNTSWYEECGVFKSGLQIDDTDEQVNNNTNVKNKNNANEVISVHGSTFYTEAGLYQTSGNSVASSSGSSGVSTGNEGNLTDEMHQSMFSNEPLYQIYNAAKLESIARDLEEHTDSSTDGYEEIGNKAVKPLTKTITSTRPSAFQLVEPKNGPSRTLWSEIAEVRNSVVWPTLTTRDRNVQEAKFEIITSEASYLKSLNLLRNHYMNNPIFRDVSLISARDYKALFGRIKPVHECCERLLSELEACWQDNIMLRDMSKHIYAVAEKHFHVYISFCENQGRMDRTLRRLKESNNTFAQQLQLLQSEPGSCGLSLHSFLMLPMQRVTRLPLLVDAVFSKISANDSEYESWKMTLAILNKIVKQCNEAANRCEQAHEIERIAKQLEFPHTMRPLAIAPAGEPAPTSKPRFLVKKGELLHLIWRGEDARLTFGRRINKAHIFAFLFSDLLVLTKRKGEDQYIVFDYCPRSMLTIVQGDNLTYLPAKEYHQFGKHLIVMTLLENFERKTVELVLSCSSVSEQERWLQTTHPPEAETPGEKLYETWDCPQVITRREYVSLEPDGLSLEVGDVLNVSRKLPDGWYHGERIRDGATGWFPKSHVEEVNSAHVRARNLKQRHRLLTFTAAYLDQQKKK